MSKDATSPAKAASSQKVLEQKWGKVALAAGFTALPDVVFRSQKALGLKPLDVLVLLHLASYWWKPDSNPWPAKGTIAASLDVDPRTVQRSIQRMEKLGFVSRIERRSKVGDNLSNAYDLSGLVAAATQLASVELQLREARVKEDASRRSAPRAFALVKGGQA